jgi:proteic killer suppression protein
MQRLSWHPSVIASFGDRATEALFHGRTPRHVPADVRRSITRKLDMLHAARDLTDLRALPGNRLHLLHGSLRGLYSLRVNDQWRIVFRWNGVDALDVRLIDYH